MKDLDLTLNYMASFDILIEKVLNLQDDLSSALKDVKRMKEQSLMLLGRKNAENDNAITLSSADPVNLNNIQ